MEGEKIISMKNALNMLEELSNIKCLRNVCAARGHGTRKWWGAVPADSRNRRSTLKTQNLETSGVGVLRFLWT